MGVVKQGAEFLQLVERSGLLNEEQIQSALWKYGLRHVAESLPIAQAFVDHHLLTKYQAERLLRGHHRGLLLDHRYKILYPVGAGGMGYVFAAEELDTNWKVAIKMIADDRRGEQAMLSRLKLEAEAGMRLSHPNILRTLSINTTEDAVGALHYVVMELVQGISLREMLDLHHPVEVGQICDVICQAATGLQHAHDKGLVHRDVKPENILIRSDGSVKLLDFGLAMLDENEQEFVMAMILGQDRVGTADFVAPEQSINSYKVDQRADIYSLGCTLYFGLTRSLPFPVASVAEKVRSHRKKRPRPVGELREGVPARVLAVLDKMIAKHPDHRVQTATDVVRYLTPFALRKPVTFDYPRILRARTKLAIRKAAARDASKSGSVTGGSVSQVKGPADADTVVQHETDVAPRPRKTESPGGPATFPPDGAPPTRPSGIEMPKDGDRQQKRL